MYKEEKISNLKPCPFCGSKEVRLVDYTETVYGFWDYKIKCLNCRAYMDSPSTAIITPIDNGIRQIRDEATKQRAKTDLIEGWNTRRKWGRIKLSENTMKEVNTNTV